MRDGNGVYSKPAGIDASPDTTIESADWNSFTADVEQDLNTARPIVAGGTGKTTAVAAADALSTQGANIASASTTNLALATGVAVTITGTTTITAFGTVSAGAIRILTFAGALTLTHNGTSLIIPGGADVTTAAGDTAELLSLGSGNWRVVRFTRAATIGNGDVTLTGTQTLTNKTLTTPTITLKQSASPTPTAEGDIQWDTDDNRLVIGDGAGQKTFSDDTKVLLLTGGTLTGAVSGVTPTNAAHLTRKDYVDGVAIGVGQTWTDVSGSRAFSTTYQNTTGRPIAVFVTGTRSGAGGTMDFLTGASAGSVAVRGSVTSTVSDARSAFTGVIVTAGEYYRVNATSFTVISWTELR